MCSLFLFLLFGPTLAALEPIGMSRLCAKMPQLCKASEAYASKNPSTEFKDVSEGSLATEDIFNDLEKYAAVSNPCSLMELSKADPADLTTALQEMYIGHDRAVKHLAAMLAKRRDNFRATAKPIVVLIMGPSGTGKTHLGRSLAKVMNTKLIEVNLNAYTEANSIAGLRGTSAGYRGFGEGTVLSPLLENPSSVVLLDEVEKAHPDVHKFFYDVFDVGHFTLANHEKVRCDRATFILTSNVGGDYIHQDAECTGKLGSCGIDQQAIALLKKHFDGDAFLNRIEAFYAFAHFQDAEVHLVGEQILRHIRQRYCRSHGYIIGWAPRLVDQILQHSTYRREEGVRALERTLLADGGVEDVLWVNRQKLGNKPLIALLWNGSLSIAHRSLSGSDSPDVISPSTTLSDTPISEVAPWPPANEATTLTASTFPSSTSISEAELWPLAESVQQALSSPVWDYALQAVTALITWGLGTQLVYLVAHLLLPVYIAQAVVVVLSASLAMLCYHLSSVLSWLYYAAWQLALVVARLLWWLWYVIPDSWKPQILWLILLLCSMVAVFGWPFSRNTKRAPSSESTCNVEVAPPTAASETQTESPSTQTIGTQTEPIEDLS